MTAYKINHVDGILLDFDGTIVPSEKVFLQTWQEVFNNQFQCPFTKEEYVTYELKRDTELIDYLYMNNRLNSKIEKSVLMQAVYDSYLTEFAKMLDHIDFGPLLNHIASWTEAGIKLGIASTSKKIYIELFFDRYENYRRIFSCILCRENMKRLKPDPMVYLSAAEYLDLTCPKCLVIEDSDKGIESAAAAGMKVVRVLENTLSMDEDSKYPDIPTLKSIYNIMLY